MNIAKIKQKARDVIHKTMSVPGLYTDTQVTDVPVTVRLHRKSAFIGDDYDQFSPGLFSEINRVILDLREVQPEMGGQIVIADYNTTVIIENYQDQGEYKVLCEVVV